MVDIPPSYIEGKGPVIFKYNKGLEKDEFFKARLEKYFEDIFRSNASLALILVQYKFDDKLRTEIGVPYAVVKLRNWKDDGIDKFALKIGPYLKDEFSPIPGDLVDRQKLIRLEDIVAYSRINLESFLF